MFTVYIRGQCSQYKSGDSVHSINQGTVFTVYIRGQCSQYKSGDSVHSINQGTVFSINQGTVVTV